MSFGGATAQGGGFPVAGYATPMNNNPSEFLSVVPPQPHGVSPPQMSPSMNPSYGPGPMGGLTLAPPLSPGGTSPSLSASSGQSFVHKLFKIVNDPETNHLIRWSPSGKSFIVTNVAEFEKVLPRFYKHRQFSSFVRQLNMYGFHKTNKAQRGSRVADSQEYEFAHELFLRERPDLLESIKRKQGDNLMGTSPGLRALEQPLAPVDLSNPVEVQSHIFAIHNRLQDLNGQLIEQQRQTAIHQGAIKSILSWMQSQGASFPDLNAINDSLTSPIALAHGGGHDSASQPHPSLLITDPMGEHMHHSVTTHSFNYSPSPTCSPQPSPIYAMGPPAINGNIAAGSMSPLLMASNSGGPSVSGTSPSPQPSPHLSAALSSIDIASMPASHVLSAGDIDILLSNPSAPSSAGSGGNSFPHVQPMSVSNALEVSGTSHSGRSSQALSPVPSSAVAYSFGGGPVSS